MRYLLVVGFHCEIYKKEPKARIFLNDTLIDEYYINFCSAKKSILPDGTLTPYPWTIRKNNTINKLPNLKIYEVELNSTNEDSIIKIEIKNNDNNYSNGFLNKSTLIKLSSLYFIPYSKKLIEKLIYRQRSIQYNEHHAWQKSIKNVLFDLLPYSIWVGKNNKRLEDNIFIGHQSIGGEGFFECKLRKKYNFFIANAKKPYRVVMPIIEIEYIINKYQQYENHRNTD